MPLPQHIPEVAITRRAPLQVLSVLTPGLMYPQLVLGLVGAWSPCLQADKGSRLWDVTGRKNDGTLTNMDPATDWVTSGGYGALDLDGSDDYVLVPANSAFSGLGASTTPMSCFAWVNRRSSGANEGPVWCDGRYYIRLNADTTGDCAVFGVGATLSGLALNTWQLVGFTWSGTTATGFVNERVTGTTTGVSTASGSPDIAIGSRVAVGAYLDGMIADVLIWNRVLTPVDVSLLYALGPGGWATRRTRRAVANISTTKIPLFMHHYKMLAS